MVPGQCEPRGLRLSRRARRRAHALGRSIVQEMDRVGPSSAARTPAAGQPWISSRYRRGRRSSRTRTRAPCATTATFRTNCRRLCALDGIVCISSVRINDNDISVTTFVDHIDYVVRRVGPGPSDSGSTTYSTCRAWTHRWPIQATVARRVWISAGIRFPAARDHPSPSCCAAVRAGDPWDSRRQPAARGRRGLEVSATGRQYWPASSCCFSTVRKRFARWPSMTRWSMVSVT